METKPVKVDGREYRVIEDLGFIQAARVWGKIVVLSSGHQKVVIRPRGGVWRFSPLQMKK